ncbi:MAG: hypothetical protein OEY81_04895 [Candidatus Bathyarchaeota archaeon]|nr:hypothetical protein [Candidatus Bathyarchaeota archaeon]
MLITEVNIGDRMKIPTDPKFHPEYGHFGKVVWISEDRKTVTIQCERRHDRKLIAVMMKNNSRQ